MLWVEREQWNPKPLDSLQKFQEKHVGLLNSENASYTCQLQTKLTSKAKTNLQGLKVAGLIMTCKN